MADNTIDTLQLEIQSNSLQASKSIDALAESLLKLNRRMVGFKNINLENISNAFTKLAGLSTGLNADKINNYVSSINGLKNSVNGFSGMDKQIGQTVKNLNNLSKIDFSGLRVNGNYSNLKTLSDGLIRFAQAASNVSKLKTAEINRTLSAFQKLSTVNFSSLSETLNSLNVADLTKLSALGQAFQGFSSMLAGSEKVSAGITRIFASLSQLAASADSIPIVTSRLPELYTKISEFTVIMSNVPVVNSGIVSLVSSLANLSTAGTKVEKTAASLPALSEGIKHFVESLAALPKLNDNVLRTVEMLTRLSVEGGKVGNSSRELKINIDSLSGSMGKLKGGASGAVSGIKSFSRQLLSALRISAGIYGLVRGVKASVNEFSNLVEVQNVVDKSFGSMARKVEELSRISITNFGMSELTLKKISSRYQAMGTAMGFTQEKMSDMSIELTKLAADMASFYNVEQKDVAKSLESIFTGTTRPLRTYGLDLTQATLQEWAMKQGMDVNIKSMSQMEKTMLRYQYVLANTKNIAGDFLLTQGSWANQVRILGQQFQQLGSIIGGGLISALLPVVTAINKIIAKIVQLANVISSFLGKLFGTKKAVSSAGAGLAGVADISGDVAENTEAAADGIAGTGGAAKKAKNELNKYIAAWHEVNNMTTNDESGSGGGSGGGGASLPDMELPDKYDFAVEVEDKASPVIEAIRQKIDSLYRYFQTGFTIGFKDDGVFESISQNLKNIKDSFVTIFTDGKVLDSFNTLLHTLAFNSGLKLGAFKTIGTSILDNILAGFSLYLDDAKERIKSWLITMFNIIGETDTIKANFITALSDIFTIFRSDDAKMITKDIIQIFSDGFFGASELAAKLGRDILGLVLNPITNNAGKIKEAIESTLHPLRTVLDTLAASFTQLWQSVNKMYDEHISPMFKSFTEGISEITGSLLDGYNTYISPVLDKLGGKFSTVWENTIHPMLDNFIGLIGDAADTVTAFWNNVFQPFVDWAAQKITPVIAPVIEGMGKLFLNNFQTMSETVNGFIDVGRDLLKFLTNSFEGDWQSAWQNIKKVFNDIWELLPNEITTPIEDAVNGLNEFINEKSRDFGEAWGTMKSKFEEIWSLMPEAIKTPIENAVTGISKFVLDISTGNWSSAWESMKSTFKSIWEGMTDVVKGPINTIIGFVNTMISAIESGVNGVIGTLNNLSIDIPETPFSDAVTLGFNLSRVSLSRVPKLAKGGIIDTATFALLGENGREVVIPLDRNKKWISQVSKGISKELSRPDFDFSPPNMNYSPKAYDSRNFKSAVRIEMDSVRAELSFENRQLRENVEQNTKILQRILDQGIVLDDNQFEMRFKRSANSYRRRTGGQLGVDF